MELIVYSLISFIFYSFVGWIIEILYHFSIHKNFKKRGFLRGPYKPMYGIAFTILILCKEVLHVNILTMALLCFIVPTFIEYISGYLLKNIFHEVYWDYSNLKYNLNGIITLRFSIYWCVLSLIGVYKIHPFIYKNVLLNFYEEINILMCVFISIFLDDLFMKLSLKFINIYSKMKNRYNKKAIEKN